MRGATRGTLQLHQKLRLAMENDIDDWWWILISHETSSTMRGATGLIRQVHQILRLPRKMNLMIDPPHIWNVQYKMRSNKSYPPTSPNTAPGSRECLMTDPHLECNVQYNAWSNRTHPPSSRNIAPATENDSDDWSLFHKKRPVQCAEQQEAPSSFTKNCAWQWKMTLMIDDGSLSHMKCPVHCAEQQEPASNFTKYFACHEVLIASANIKTITIRAWSEPDPTMKSSSRTRRFGDLTRPILETHFVWKNTTFGAPAISQNFTKWCACHKKVTVQLHQILRLPRKMNLMIDPPHIWNVQYNARSNKRHPPASPKTAPGNRKWHGWLILVSHETSSTMRGATGLIRQVHQILRLPRKNESHDWSSSHMKRPVQDAEQQELPSHFTKYCAWQ